MRIFASILLIYILFLTAMPTVGVASSKQEVSCCADSCGDQHEADESDKNCDVCNPLLCCSCFSGFIINSNSFNLGIIKRLEDNKVVFVPSFPLQLSYSIWQPPKIKA